MLLAARTASGPLRWLRFWAIKHSPAPIARHLQLPTTRAAFAPLCAKARNVIFLYMDGGPSQVDTFDLKPRLRAEHGQTFKMKMEHHPVQ